MIEDERIRSSSGVIPEMSDCMESFFNNTEEDHRIFCVLDNEIVTFGVLRRGSEFFARYFLHLGIKPGDHVAVMLGNDVFTIKLIFALIRSGIIWIPLNIHLRSAGFEYILQHADVRLLIIADELRAFLPEGINETLCLTRSKLIQIYTEQEEIDEELPELPDFGAVCAISYTSGTTGAPKGVLLTRKMLTIAGHGVIYAAGIGDGDVLFHWEPLYHIGGSQMLVVPLIKKCHLHMTTRFSASRFWAQVRASGATHIHYLGGVLQILLRQDPCPDEQAHKVRVAWGGGTPLDMRQMFARRFGVAVHECYGMTEASSIATCTHHQDQEGVGYPLPWFAIDVQDENRHSLLVEQKGQIVITARIAGAISQGYYREPAITARTFQGQTLYTGDEGAISADGTLLFHGRLTDSLRCGGENISAWEVEHVVCMHPQVVECAVIGVRADIGEQEIKLFVRLRPDITLSCDQLSEWLSGRLARYQRPRYICFVQDFPRTPSQRIMKHQLPASTEDVWDRLDGA